MQFIVEQEQTNQKNKTTELIKQIEALQKFYYDIGYDSENIKLIFSLTLSYLRGNVNQLVVSSFFDVLMSQNKLSNGKELNLLNCFDSLINDIESDEEEEATQLMLDLQDAA